MKRKIKLLMAEFETKYPHGWIQIKFNNATFESGSLRWKRVDSAVLEPNYIYPTLYEFESSKDVIAKLGSMMNVSS